MAITVIPGLLVLLLYFENTSAQLQLQPFTKPCNTGSAQNSGLNYNIGQSGNFGPSSQGPTQQLQPVRPKQNPADILSALYNFRSPGSNPPVSCGSKQSDPILNQPGVTIVPTCASNQPPVATYVDPSQPTFSFQFVPTAPQTAQSPQIVLQNPVMSQPFYQTSNPMPPTSQSPTIIPVASSKTSPVQSQPIVFTLQSPQSELSQSLSHNQPAVLYTVQAPPSQQGQMQTQTPAPTPSDPQSMMSLLMSQLQSPNGSPNALSSMLPSLFNTKQEKSSSMKSLLPLILNLLNDKRPNCCQCGCPTNPQDVINPTVHSGYSNQKDYSQKEVLGEMDQSKYKSSKNKKNGMNNVSEESEEEEEYDDDEEGEETEE